jgi:hypothetical protein
LFGALARTMRTTLPSNSNSTSVCGNSPACSRMFAGMVTCPLDVMRMLAPYSYE